MRTTNRAQSVAFPPSPRGRRVWTARVALLAIVVAAPVAPADPPGAPTTSTGVFPEPSAAAMWELRLLGCTTPARLARLRRLAKRRRVSLGIVGQDGVSRRQLEPLLGDVDTLRYHGCDDPGTNTHDTQMARVILELTRPLGVRLDVHIWQAGPAFSDYAAKFRQAARKADIVVLFQSFWGTDAGLITRAIRQSPGALFISPYVEFGGHPTSQTPQGSACRPWSGGTIGHFVTVAPLPRRGTPGIIVHPSDRGPGDTEAVNFIAPSYHANGPGGTCPSAAVATACACYLYALSPARPTPAEIIARLRRSSTLDRERLTSVAEFDAAAIERLAEQIARLRHPPTGRRRKLDAAGVLDLYAAAQADTRTPSASVPRADGRSGGRGDGRRDADGRGADGRGAGG